MATTAGTHPHAHRESIPARLKRVGSRKLGPWTIVVSILLAVTILFGPFTLGLLWHWSLSWGGSYGQTFRGPVWVHEATVTSAKQVEVGSNVTYTYVPPGKLKPRGAMKRIWQISPDGKWAWVGGDNHADGGSSGSYEVGWLALPGASGPPPSRPTPIAVPTIPIRVKGVVDNVYAPLDKRSEVERFRAFHFDPTWISRGPGQYWAGQRDKMVEMYEGTRLIDTKSGRASGWKNGVLYYCRVSASGETRTLEWTHGHGEKTLSDVRLASFNTKTSQGWIVSGKGPSDRDPLAVLDGSQSTAWSTSIRGSFWQVDLGSVQDLALKCWGGSSGMFPLTDGWQSSVDGKSWTTLLLVSSTGSSSTDQTVFSTCSVRARYLQFAPSAEQPSGVYELKIRAATKVAASRITAGG